MKQLLARSIVQTLVVVSAFSAVSGGAAYASGFSQPTNEKMDIETHSFLIDKLEAVVKSTPKGDSSRVPALLRLADLYSERARLSLMKEFEAGCTTACKSGEGDRAKAIAFYEVALDESKGQVRQETESRILFQLAHLYEIQGKDGKAEELYKRILKLGSAHFSAQILGQSESGLGELAFKNKNFKEARAHFESALSRKQTPRQGWAHYRIAWCDMNLGKADAGKARLFRVLQSPALLTTESTAGSKVDVSFQEDVARDLTLFLVRTGFTDRDVENLIRLTPATARKSVLVGLADEAERLGQKRQAISVWTLLIGSKVAVLENREKIEASVRVAYMQYGLENKQQAASQLDQGLALWKKSGCEPDAECAILQKRFRKLVLDWNKSEETKPSASLLGAYVSYAGTFKTDVEMAYWGGNIARELKRHREAVSLYRQSAEMGAREIRSGKVSDPNIPKVFEASLVAEIEMAEASGDVKVREEAYNHYLELNPNGAKEFDVRYQLAHLAYKRGETEKAAEQFYGLAAQHKTCESAQPALCKTAADLALDSLVILKRDEQLEARAIEFGRKYPSSAAEYRAIARRARLNISAQVAGKETNVSVLNENIKKLRQVDLAGASREEVMLTYQNRFVLAEKAKNFSEAELAIAQQIKTPGLSESEREEAKAKQLWLFEMQLKFADAYKTAKTMKFSKLSTADREIKLSMLAELSGQDARQHLRRYLESTRDAKGEIAARVKLLKLANFSIAEWNSQAGHLARNPRIFAAAGVEVYARTGSKKVIEQVLSNRQARSTADGLHLLRARERKSIETFLSSVPGSLTSEKGIPGRVKWLQNADTFANSVIRQGDAWLETGVLNVVARENRRLNEEIIALPIPAGMKGEQERVYRKLVAAKVHLYLLKAKKIESKLEFFLASERTLINYEADLAAARDSRRNLLVSEAKFLARMAPEAIARRLERAASRPVETVQPNAVQAAIEDVRENPFDLSSIRELRDIEMMRGQETMVAYLDTRIRGLERGSEGKR